MTKSKKISNKKVEKPEFDFVIYTDGGFSQLKRLGAFAYVILKNGKEWKKFAQKFVGETNNRGELNAILYATREIPENSKILIRTDSQYSIGVLDPGSFWNPTKNLDIIEEFEKVLDEKNLDVTFEWVKGHNGDKYNEMCDSMCDKAAGMDLNAEFKERNKGIRERKDNIANDFTRLFSICETVIDAYYSKDVEYLRDSIDELINFLNEKERTNINTYSNGRTNKIDRKNGQSLHKKRGNRGS